MMGGWLSLGSTLARGCRALPPPPCRLLIKVQIGVKTCPEVFGEGESASEEPEALVDSPDMGWVSIGEDPLRVVGDGGCLRESPPSCPYNDKRWRPPPFKPQGMVAVSNGWNRANRGFGENDKNSPRQIIFI